MFVATHAAVGALFGEVMPSHPILVFVLAFVVHFFMDMIPHGDSLLYHAYSKGDRKKLAMFIQISDIVIMICFAVYLCTQVIVHQRLAVIMGIAGGVLPDALVA